MSETRRKQWIRKMREEGVIPRHISDAEHCAIINRYRELRSMAKVGKCYFRSPETVRSQITQHNRLWKENDLWCPRCGKAGDDFVAHDCIEINGKVLGEEVPED